MSARSRIAGKALPLRGDDVDTDRIIPARFLKTVTFEGLGEHAFEDDRKAAAGAHPFDRREHQDARILLVNRNFGCGSSREHAPQALARRGILAVAGESFSEIFRGNAAAIGLPCVTVPRETAVELQSMAEADPSLLFELDLASRSVAAGGRSVAVALPDGLRESFLSGSWDGTSQLLLALPEARDVAERLPYVRGFAA
jgi:3-isopropylmalate/(R)-2-methylmalate dehydratase small subunit